VNCRASRNLPGVKDLHFKRTSLISQKIDSSSIVQLEVEYKMTPRVCE
jgi:hypothetical protein